MKKTSCNTPGCKKEALYTVKDHRIFYLCEDCYIIGRSAGYFNGKMVFNQIVKNEKKQLNF